MENNFTSNPKDPEIASSELAQHPQRTLTKPTINILYYHESEFEEKEIKELDECAAFKNKEGVSWVNLESINQSKILENITKFFNVKSLTLEKILDPNLQGKVEDHGSNINIFLKTSTYEIKHRQILTQRISLIIGSNFLLLFQKGGEANIFEVIRDKIRSNIGDVRKLKADYLAYMLMDEVVDNYTTVLEKLSEKIPLIEEELIKNPTSHTLNEIHTLKREMIFLYRSVLSVVEIATKLQKSNSKLILTDTKNSFQELLDHCNQAKGNIETFRDIVSDMLEIYLSSLTNKTNEVIRVLTIISTIFIPPTFVASIYGMNFEKMPELKSDFGYPMVILIILTVITSMLFYFRRKRWF